jgi:dienelactone hydrolase
MRSTPKFKRWQEIQGRLSKLRQGGFDASREEDLAPLAATIARELDQALAGAAYAVEAVLDYVDKQRPDLQNIPVVMLGFSAGALATPTAAARIDAISPGRISAIVIVGGGCNLFRLSQESSFTDGGLKIRAGQDRAPKATIDKLSDLYLKASKLDPYYTAPLIAHLPILQVHASTDTWVPAACGELLYERLDYPERLVMSGDHDYLFYFLPKRAKWIADWVERAASSSTASGHASAK